MSKHDNLLFLAYFILCLPGIWFGYTLSFAIIPQLMYEVVQFSTLLFVILLLPFVGALFAVGAVIGYVWSIGVIYLLIRDIPDDYPSLGGDFDDIFKFTIGFGLWFGAPAGAITASKYFW